MLLRDFQPAGSPVDCSPLLARRSCTLLEPYELHAQAALLSAPLHRLARAKSADNFARSLGLLKYDLSYRWRHWPFDPPPQVDTGPRLRSSKRCNLQFTYCACGSPFVFCSRSEAAQIAVLVPLLPVLQQPPPPKWKRKVRLPLLAPPRIVGLLEDTIGPRHIKVQWDELTLPPEFEETHRLEIDSYEVEAAETCILDGLLPMKQVVLLST